MASSLKLIPSVLNFKIQETEISTILVHLQNTSDHSVEFQIVTSAFFIVEPHLSKIDGKSKIPISIKSVFPCSPCNVFDYLYVLSVDESIKVPIIVTYSDEARNIPPPLSISQVYLMEELEILGVPEIPDGLLQETKVRPSTCMNRDISISTNEVSKILELSVTHGFCPVITDSHIIDIGDIHESLMSPYTGNIKSYDMKLINTSDKDVIVTFNTDKISIQSDSLLASISPSLLQIPAKETRTVKISILKMAEFIPHLPTVLSEFFSVSVCYMEDAHIETASTHKLLPPWTLNFHVIGHLHESMEFLNPDWELSQKMVNMPACSVDMEISTLFSVRNLNDKVSLSMKMDISDIRFQVVPSQLMVIPPGKTMFACIKFKAKPTETKDLPGTECVKTIMEILFDGKELYKVPLVSKISILPQLVFPGLFALPPVPVGSSCIRGIPVRNDSDIPVSVFVAVENSTEFVVPLPQCTINPKTTVEIPIRFGPCTDAQKITCVGKITGNFHNGPPMSKTFGLIGVSLVPEFRVNVSEIDIGSVITDSIHYSEFSISNESPLIGYYDLSLKDDLGMIELLTKNSGSLTGSGIDIIKFSVRSKKPGNFESTIFVNSCGHEVGSVSIKVNAISPTVVVSSVRGGKQITDSVSDLWGSSDISDFNRIADDENLTDIEIKFHRTNSIELKQKLAEEMRNRSEHFINFPPSICDSNTTEIFVTLKNTSEVPAAITIFAPSDFGFYEFAPKWAIFPIGEEDPLLIGDPDIPQSVLEESHYEWVENNKLFEISPKMFTINPLEESVIRFSYLRKFTGTHKLPILFQIAGGRCLPFSLIGLTYVPQEPKLELKGFKRISPVAINSDTPYLHSLELRNRGGSHASFFIDPENMRIINETLGHNWPVFDVYPLEGFIAPGDSCALTVKFFPREAKAYSCELPVFLRLTVSEDGEEEISSETLRFTLTAFGFDPREGRASTNTTTDTLPSDIPISSTFPENFNATISPDVVDFDCLHVEDIKALKLVVLSNRNPHFSLKFNWLCENLPGKALKVHPNSGVISPGGEQILTFELSTDLTMVLSHDLVCSFEWIKVSRTTTALEDSVEFEEDTKSQADSEEIFAFHTSRPLPPVIAKPFKSKRAHVPVMNRLTISRLRALMTSRGGQKFLSENIQTENAQLSAYLPEELTETDFNELLRLGTRSSVGTAPVIGHPMPWEQELRVRIICRILHKADLEVSFSSPDSQIVEFGTSSSLKDLKNKFLSIKNDPSSGAPSVKSLLEKNAFLGAMKGNKELRDEVMDAIRLEMLNQIN
jgi:hypothetical protein